MSNTGLNTNLLTAKYIFTKLYVNLLLCKALIGAVWGPEFGIQ